ncbi:hypothetical protein SARC_02600 [Sphaeroforma arctica JP610]|uniref:PX domain-containing protein n=1 Tax=Sphaeroforma arctica JP610 TaxID=667725 RepID=A0A0L0G8L5_9EUKA|nr:hypothetical protein, variant [Sphaeroforma arctica JP610]XP_014159128.1 hypothetical protein SARC_02600 [Sphaeroforma arctica JP610]KNC85225.1 hypothetical protein, variant [Sphaeroforma arctica JP610]KNC85226.1 hypothetical protein SARC_02600 [Sphaeroforma arctica JP610]|eukprot:XP_014159127.1 hypothetical protein, variant [Sphaeroforma arctica JP610]
MSSEIVHEQSSQLIVVKPISRATVILGVREKSGTTDEHTAYKIVCEKPGGSRYVVLKRFSDFYRLRTAVTKTLGRIDPGIKTIIGHALYAFPKRRYFNNLSDEMDTDTVKAMQRTSGMATNVLPTSRVSQVKLYIALYLTSELSSEDHGRE